MRVITNPQPQMPKSWKPGKYRRNASDFTSWKHVWASFWGPLIIVRTIVTGALMINITNVHELYRKVYSHVGIIGIISLLNVSEPWNHSRRWSLLFTPTQTSFLVTVRLLCPTLCSRYIQFCIQLNICWYDIIYIHSLLQCIGVCIYIYTNIIYI